MKDFIIVGAGIFGRVIGDALARKGFSVEWYDCHREAAGSPPAACLMKPSWLSSMSTEELDDSLKLLDELYGIEDVPFRFGKKAVNVHWVNPHSILRPVEENIKVLNVSYNDVLTDDGWRSCKKGVIVCAGIWTHLLIAPELVNRTMPYWIDGQAGVSFFWPGAEIPHPFIKLWAPYKQVVAFNMNDGVWCGDGTAIRHTNWTHLRQLNCLQRCAEATGLDPQKATINYGIRPYVRGANPCLLKFLHNITVATGGAKNGTASAAWCANRILERYK